MESIHTLTDKFSQYVRKQVASYASILEVLQFAAGLLAFSLALDLFFALSPRLKSAFIFRKLHQVLKLAKVVCFITVFFIADSSTERSTVQKAALAFFSIFTIWTIIKVGAYLGLAIVMLARTRNCTLAMSAPRAMVMDGNVYPVDCFNPVIMITKDTTSGALEYRFGEHCLPTQPTYVAYRSAFSSIEFQYHTTMKYEQNTIILFRAKQVTV